VSDPQISPSGKWVMFSVVDVDLEKNSKVGHLWIVPMAGGEARQVTFWKEGETGGRFSPDGKQILFVSEDGTGSSQIYLASWMEATGTLGTPNRLTNVSTEADGAIWSPDSQRILFTSRVYPECSNEDSWIHEDACNKRKDDAAAASPVKAQVFDHLLYRHWNMYVGEKRSHVLVVSVSDGNMVRDLTPRRAIGDAEAPTFSLGGPIGYAWAPDSQEIAYVTNLDLVPAASTNNDVFTLRLDEPGSQAVRISTSPGGDDAPAYSPDGKYLAFRSQVRAGYESDRFRLMLFDREAKTTKELLPKFDRWVDELVWVPDSKLIYFASGDVGGEKIFSVEPTGQALVQSTISGEVSDLRVSPDGLTIVASSMSVDSPASIHSYTSLRFTEFTGVYRSYAAGASPDKTEKANAGGVVPISSTIEKPLTTLNANLLAELDLPRMESFWFTGAEGAKVQGFIIRPPNFDPSREYPLKFLIHGGPQGAWGDAWSYRWNAQLLAANGYVVVMVNPRGSTGYGQAFIDGVNGDWGGKPYVDLMKGLDYAEQHYPFIDKTRECALGASYGGYMANWILTHTNRFACIVTHDGMFNPQSAYGTTEELWFNEWEFRMPSSKEPGQPWGYFDKPVAMDPFRKWSPMLSIRNARTPTLVVHSQRDYRLDVSEGFQLFTALQRLNVPSRMLYFPDEGHWVLKPQNSRLWYREVNDWCDRWTKTNAYATEMPRTAAKVAVTPVSPAKPMVRAQAPEAAAKAPEPPRATTQPQMTSDRAAFSITISAPEDEVQLGTDIRLSIVLKNISDHQITFGHHPGTDYPEFSYRIEVKNTEGRLVEESGYARAAREPSRQQSAGYTVEYLPPGGSAVQTAHLLKLVNLSRPGRYTVQVSRENPASNLIVTSNQITLNVVPAVVR
jgi:dipeptidyl aminopeptidase/acylaminoacyl peptidase